MIRRFSVFNATSLALGFAFLYLPILLLAVFSFNDSRLVTVWGGFSTRWYGALFRNEPIIEAAWITLRIALVSATFATVLGTRGGGAGALRAVPRADPLHRHGLCPDGDAGGDHRPRAAALLRRRRPRPGLLGRHLAHTTLTMCFVTVVVQARLVGFDRSLEEAAMDLGAPPLKTFFAVTLPLIAPSIAAGFLLAFTRSLDDLVIASFNTGPGVTLPIRIYSGASRALAGGQRGLHHPGRHRGGRRHGRHDPEQAGGAALGRNAH